MDPAIYNFNWFEIYKNSDLSVIPHRTKFGSVENLGPPK